MYRAVLGLVLLSAGFSVGAAETVAGPGAPASVRETTTVKFLGKDFQLKDKAEKQAVPVYEFFPQGDNPPAWNELVDFRMYPSDKGGNSPKELAARTAKAFKEQFPYMQFAMYENSNDNSVLLDFFYPTSSRKDGDFLEFNAFKFYKEPGGNATVSFHYAKNIEGPSKTRDMSAVSADMKSTRAALVPAMASFPLYRQ